MSSYSINFTAVLSAVSGNVSPGYGACREVGGTGRYVVATTANLAAADALLAGVILTPGTSSTAVALLSSGELSAAISGLGAGAAGPVGLDANGKMTRAVSADDAIGRCDTLGNCVIGTTGSGSATSIPGIYNVQDYGALGDCIDNNAATGTNDTPAFQAAMDAMVADSYEYNARGLSGASLYVPPLPVGRSYLLAGYADDPTGHHLENKSALDIQAGLVMYGAGGQANNGSQLTLGPGLSIRTYTITSSPNGGNAENCIIRNLTIFCTPPTGVALWQASTAYAVGAAMSITQDYRFWYECIIAGTSSGGAEPNFGSQIDVADRSIPWSAGRGNIRYGTVVRSSDPTQWDVFFILYTPSYTSATSYTTSATEPTWNYGVGATTNETSAEGPTLTWYRVPSSGYIVQDGTAVFAARMAAGILAHTVTHVQDVEVYTAYGPAFAWQGNTTATPASACNSSSGTRITARQARIGMYVAGYDASANVFVLCNMFGLQVGTDPANIGIWDGTFLGSYYFGPQTQAFTGAPFKMTSLSGQGVIIGHYIEGSQGVSQIAGLWQVFGGDPASQINWAGAAPSVSVDGAHYMYERSRVISPPTLNAYPFVEAYLQTHNSDALTVFEHRTGLNSRNIESSTGATPIVVTVTAHGIPVGATVTITRHTSNPLANGVWTVSAATPNTFTLAGSTSSTAGGADGQADAPVDNGYHAKRYNWSAGAWSDTYILDGVSFVAEMTEGIVSTSGAGMKTFPRGYFAGSGSDKLFHASTLATWEDVNIRDGSRIVGDTLRLASYATVGGYAQRIVTTAGYAAPTWAAATAYAAIVGLRGLASHTPASIVKSTNPAILDVYRCTLGGNSAAFGEPNWAAAPNLNDVLTDAAGIEWINIGVQPVLSSVGLIV
jgi:hypothetical protein